MPYGKRNSKPKWNWNGAALALKQRSRLHYRLRVWRPASYPFWSLIFADCCAHFMVISA